MSIYRYFTTLKYLRVGQIFHLIKNRFFKNKENYSQQSLKTRKKPEAKLISIKTKDSYLGDGRFFFLNEIQKIQTQLIWHKKKLSLLWEYNLHYFDFLNSESSYRHNSDFILFVKNWIRLHKNISSPAWDPYPTSLRICNWIKWDLKFGTLDSEAKRSLVRQSNFLMNNIEYHLLGNHVLKNAKALIYAGLYFEDALSDRWLKKGLEIFNKELQEQFLPDGGHFELSPMYHSICLEDILDIYSLYIFYDIDIPFCLDEHINKMSLWLQAMSHPDGEISFFNDSCLNVASCNDDIFDFCQKLKINLDKLNQEIIFFKDSGYIRVNKKDYVAILDVAKIGPDYQPGHGHADVLSFEVSLFKKRFIVNSGISTYDANKLRLNQRGTSLHSSLTINDENSSLIWDSFRVGKRAVPYNICIEKLNQSCKIQAAHDGFSKFFKKRTHRREWFFHNNSIIVQDNVKGFLGDKVKSNFYLGPEVKFIRQIGQEIFLKIDKKDIKIESEGDGEIFVTEGFYYPEFNLKTKNYRICIQHIIGRELFCKISLKISWKRS